MIYNLWTNCFILTLTFTLVGNLVAQEKAMFSFGNGIEVVAPDSSISLKFNFNLQNRLDVKTHSTDDWEVDEFSARIRRFRLKFTGFVLDPRITYKIQLAMAPRNNSNTTLGQAPRVMYDAMFSYRVNDRFTIGFGQTALPGNRQRMNSSTALQMVDRS
ncbi:MAG TPA: porin, partial [Membranihabitans sp.]|nr:porin [Membranihabitans sp.]